ELMTLQHADTIIAFVAVMLAASLVVTAGAQFVVSLLGLRGANLRRSLADLFETACQDRDAKRYAKEISRRVLRHPLISGSTFSRFGIRVDELPFVPPDAGGKLRWAGNGIPFLPSLLGALAGCFALPIALVIIQFTSSVDFCKYSDLVTGHIPALSVCEHPWRSGAILGAILGGLISRWRLATSVRLEELIAALDKLSAPRDGTLPDPAQRAMLVIAGEAQSGRRPKMNAVSAQYIDRSFQETLDDEGGGVAVAVEKAVTQIPAHAEARLDGLNSWFDHAMDRASQRFTLQARMVTFVLSVLLVFAAHLDAIRLFQMLSSDAQVRAQLAGSADAMIRQSEQLSRIRDGAGLQPAREVARSVVPDVYRKALAVVLQPAPAASEQPKSKPRSASRSVVPALSGDSSQLSGRDSAVTNATQEPPATGEAGQSAAPTAQPAAAARPKQKIPKAETEKSAAAPTPRENNPASEAKARAAKVSDADKLIDHSASLRRGLARSEIHLLPEKWPGWNPTEHELPGLLVAIAFLSLGAPICYNLLKNIASLHPLQAMKRE
ncbi:MAG: hypothetical protein ABSA96_11275, partial [Candidatus Acidiferrales bacterium]